MAISNRILDPARMNRAVIMRCGQADKKNLETVAQGIVSDFEQLKPVIKSFCASFEKLMQSPKFTKIFGLRDFYHFLRYMERNLSKAQNLIYDVIQEGLERNFNGVEKKDFEEIRRIFFNGLNSIDYANKHESRLPLDVLISSIQDKSATVGNLNDVAVRFKLIIGETHDESIYRLFFAFKKY